ncbi:unnamed protein product [Pseudo-nitzschia multistriata]|uniref:CRAL-TRIO domain-containing protein n=1 Tax=Pseudo-nitzschia multistriata TaxID=183589 RepID=A0A448ZSJ1_9STRA|nr:unnamed protein product [Pseudo-nitzschia multistriata]
MTADSIEKSLKEEFPDATEAECFRFVQAAKAVHKKANAKLDKDKLIKDTASEKLEEYLEWRSLYGLDYDRPAKDADDSSIWEWAARKALGAAETKKREAEALRAAVEAKRAADREARLKAKRGDVDDKPPKVDYDAMREQVMREEELARTGGGDDGQTDDEENNDSKCIGEGKAESKTTLPQVFFRRKDPKTGKLLCDKKGTELIHVLAARIDRFATDNETWALAVALYIDASVDRNSKHSFAILVDARSGEGWPNPVILMIVSLIGQIVTEIEKRQPERCKSLIICPLPRALMMVWGTVRGFYSAEMNELIIAFSGPSGIGSPLPKKKLDPHVEDATIEFFEQCRRDLFVCEVEDEKV